MSTIKWKFNIWTVIMFLWCLALSIVITQPILARADNQWRDVVIDTTFSDAKNMSLDTLSVSNSMNVWNSKILDWQICHSGGACLDLGINIISLNKIRIWDERKGFLISWDQLIYNYEYYWQTGQDVIIDINKRDNAIHWYDEDIYTALTNGYRIQEQLLHAHLFEERIDSEYNQGLADYNKPLFATKSRWYEISFKTTDENGYLCDSDHPQNAWTMTYREDNGWSQLIVCMKFQDTYSWVVIKDTHNLSSHDSINP